MFYQKPFDQALRFGDIVHGFISSVLRMDRPTLDHKHVDYQLEIGMPEYCVVFSPCCSIGDETITLIPLQHILPRFLENPFFEEDLTNINRRMPPEKAVSPEVWERRISSEEKARRLQEGIVYTLNHFFVYTPDEVLPQYSLKFKNETRQVGHYMIDFRRSFRVRCPQIQSAERSPLESKLLQLSVESRQELRDKVSWYYSRPPQEDQVLLGAK
ncbi:MAG: hypothetical protein HRF40_04060, partial [Nitrososphaera sp.]